MNNFIRGNFNSQTIRDTKGTTYQDISGNHNNLRFVGDNGANTFRVGGTGNRVSIENIGRDENIMLEGRPQDWVQSPDCNPRDGKVTFVNRITGNEVTLKTDAGRNDNFVKSKIGFTGDYQSLANPINRSCPCVGGWNNIGNMSMNPGCFDPRFTAISEFSAYSAGYAAGRRDGFSLGAGFGSWATMAMLPFNCWSLLS